MDANQTGSDTQRLVTQWPGACLLDATGTVVAHGPLPGALARLAPTGATGRALLTDVLGGAPSALTHVWGTWRQGHAATLLDLEESVRVPVGRLAIDVRVHLRSLAGVEGAVALALVTDDTARKTTERALAAALGDGGDATMLDPETGLYGRRQFDFLLPIELRRGQRYGLQTTLLGVQPELLTDGVWSSEAVTPALLRELADRIQRSLRQTDVIFHLRLHRLHVVLTHTDAEGAQVAAQRVHGALAAQAGTSLRGRVAMSASGTPTSPPPALAWAREMLAEVDQLLDVG